MGQSELPLVERNLFHTPQEFDLLLKLATKDPRAHMLFTVVGEAGIRIEEAHRILAEDVHPVDPILRVRRAKKRRNWISEIVMPPEVMQRLRDWIKGLGLAPDAKVFGWSKRVSRLMYDRYARPAGIREKGRAFHALRHMKGLDMAEKGVPPHVIQKHFDHEDIRVTMRYVHTVSYREWMQKCGRVGTA